MHRNFRVFIIGVQGYASPISPRQDEIPHLEHGPATRDCGVMPLVVIPLRSLEPASHQTATAGWAISFDNAPHGISLQLRHHFLPPPRISSALDERILRSFGMLDLWHLLWGVISEDHFASLPFLSFLAKPLQRCIVLLVGVCEVTEALEVLKIENVRAFCCGRDCGLIACGLTDCGLILCCVPRCGLIGAGIRWRGRDCGLIALAWRVLVLTLVCCPAAMPIC